MHDSGVGAGTSGTKYVWAKTPAVRVLRSGPLHSESNVARVHGRPRRSLPGRI